METTRPLATSTGTAPRRVGRATEARRAHGQTPRSIGFAFLLLLGLTLSACTIDSEPPAIPAMPPPPTLSEAEADARLALDRQDALKVFKEEHPEAEVPQADLVRTVSRSEWPEAYAACMTERGFPSTVLNGGVFADGLPAGQELAYAGVVYQCRVAYPIDPALFLDYSSEELAFLHSYFSEVLTPCLINEGLDVPRMPTLQSFQEAYVSGVEWNPYDEVLGVSENRFYELMELCPRFPEGFRGH